MNLKNSVSQEPSPKDTWEDFGSRAESERTAMAAEFFAWAMKKRSKLEERLFHNERHMTECAPFARAGMNNAETPAEVPLAVLEFASTALDVLDYQRELEKLNAYYRHSVSQGIETTLAMGSGKDNDLHHLWEQFLEEREENK